MKLDKDARKQLDEHLDGIDRVLAGQGVARAQRKQITDATEAHIRDRLHQQQLDGARLDVRAILADLDPPEVYADPARREAAMARVVRTPRMSRAAVWGCITGLLGAVAIAVALLIEQDEPAGLLPQPGFVNIASYVLLLVGWLAALAMFVLGLVALVQIAHNPRRRRGLPLAFFNLLFYPAVLFAWLFIELTLGPGLPRGIP